MRLPPWGSDSGPEPRAQVSEMEWFIKKEVFPGTELPWSLPEYKGDKADHVGRIVVLCSRSSTSHQIH